MKLKNWRYLDIFTVFNFQDSRARGRCVMLVSAVMSTLASQLCMSGTIYTAFLTANHFSIVDTGVLTFIAPITACFSIFSPALLERFKRRRAILTIGRILYYSINIIGITLLTYLAKDQTAKLIGFAVIIFLSHSCNALTSSGYTVWHLNFIPNDVRMRYFSYQQIISGLSSGLLLMVSGAIADAIRGTAHELTILLVLRLIGYAFAIADIVALALPKEYPYPSDGKRIRIANTFLLPFRHKKFMFTMLLLALWGFGSALPSTWTYYLMNTVDIKITLINAIEFAYAIVLLLVAPFARRMLSRFSWFNTFAAAAVCHGVLTFSLAFIRSVPNPSVYFVVIRLLQHIEGVALNLSYANFPFINMPKENQTCFLSFYTFMVNLVNFSGQMTGTFLVKLLGSRLIPLFGTNLEAPALLVLIQALFQFAVAALIFSLQKQLKPDGDTA